MVKSITLSFKDDEADIRKHIEKHSSMCGYIKDLIRADMEKEREQEKPKNKSMWLMD